MSGLYTRYIKIAKIDSNGNDNTDSLSTLTTITIPWSDGSEARYNVIGISQQTDYFSYVVDYESTSSIYYPDASTLDYNFSGSYTTSPILLQSKGVGDFTYLPITQSFPIGSYDFPVNGPDSILNGIDKAQLKWNTYPQKDISIQFSGSVTANASSNAILECMLQDSNLNFVNPTFTTGPSLVSLVVSIGAGNTESFNVEWFIPSGSFDPGSSLRIVATSPLITTLTFDPTTFLHVSSSVGNRTELQAVIEPYLDYKFTNSDCDVLQNNVLISRPNPFIQDIDYNTSQIIPTNYLALKNYTATKGTYPESNFTITSILNPSYGSKNQTIDFNVYNPQSGTTAFGDPVNIGTYGQTPSATISSNFAVYFKALATYPQGSGKKYQRFEPSYLITPNEKLLEITSDNLIIEQLKQAFNPIPFPSSKFGDPIGPLTFKSVSFSSTGSYTGNYTGIGRVSTGSQGDIFLDIFFNTNGGFNGLPDNLPEVRNAGGLVFPTSIEFSETPDLPSKAKEILSKNNLI